MDAFFISTVSIASAEFGDKTQLLALLLATRFKKPWPIVWGIFIATLLNHAVAALLGEWIGAHLHGTALHGLLGALFLIAAFWILKPDSIDEVKEKENKRGIFFTTLITFFIAEMGDKTQIATALMAAQFQSLIPVVLGTTLGMLLVNIPVVFVGEKVTNYLPIKTVRYVSAGIFFLLAVWELTQLYS